jgi:hypothetical protein
MRVAPHWEEGTDHKGATYTGGVLTIPGNSGGKTISFTVAGNGLSDYVITYQAANDTGIGWAYSQTWAYDVGNGFTSAGITQLGSLPGDGQFRDYTLDLSGITALADVQGPVTFRNTFGTFFGFTAPLRFDNITVEAVPEPSQILVLVGGMILLGLVEWRRRRRRRG